MITLNAITDVPGFKASGVTCGLKKSGNKDVALIVADSLCHWAAVFTTNVFQAAPVVYDRTLLAKTGGSGLRAVLINAGNANACTGEQGLRDAEMMARLTEKAAALPADSAFVMSTGVIGHLLPMDKVEAGIALAVDALSPQGGTDAATAIMTTDLTPKAVFTRLPLPDGRTVSLGGIAKGSGMIHPNMATMLSVIVTDAPVSPADLDAALHQAANVSFNRISVDGDTSTNDTLVLLASGSAGGEALAGPALAQFIAALTDLCTQLAKMIARDGEGATKLVEIRVNGAQSEADALLAAQAIATSPLSKTAIFGNDPNWGRFLAAAGRSGARVDPAKTALWLATPQMSVQLVSQGQPLPFDAVALNGALKAATEAVITLDLGLGAAEVVYWTCDLSYKYVEINAEYHT